MKYDLNQRRRKQMVLGILLIGFGTLMLLDRAGWLELDVDLRRIWHFWPLILLVFGINDIMPPSSPRLFLNGLFKIFFAGWWYVSYEHLWGLTFRDTWPALLIAWGTGMVLRPAVVNYFAGHKEQG